MTNELVEFYKETYQAMISKDVASLKRLHHPNFTLTHMTGTRQRRDAYIQDIVDRQLDYRHVVHDHIDVKVNGDQATIVGQSRVDAAVYGGQCHTWRLQLIFKCQKINNQWQHMSCVASMY